MSDSQIAHIFGKHVEMLQNFLLAHVEILEGFYKKNFKKSGKKEIAYFQSDLTDLIRVNTQLENDNTELFEKILVFYPYEESKKLDIPKKDKDFIAKYKGNFIFCHVVLIDNKGVRARFTKTYLAHKEDDRPIRYVKFSHKEEDEEIKFSEEKRNKWVEVIKEKIINESTLMEEEKKDFKFPKEVENWFIDFVKDFKFSRKMFMIERTYFVLWPEVKSKEGNGKEEEEEQ